MLSLSAKCWQRVVLIAELQERAPACRVLVSTTTRTSQELARKKYGEDRVFYFPLDFNWAVRRYLDAFRPALVVLLETEFWPNFLAACRRRGIPVAVVNARISDRSYPRYLRLRSLWKKLLSGVNFALAQSPEDQARLVAIGMEADRVRVGGNLKFDVAFAGDGASDRRDQGQPANARKVAGGGKHAGGRREHAGAGMAAHRGCVS